MTSQSFKVEYLRTEKKSIDSDSRNVIQEITEETFNAHLGQLELAIIETTTVDRQESSARYHYLAKRKIDYIKDFVHKRYIKTIKEIKESDIGSLSKYIGWYQRDEFPYILGYNQDCESNDTDMLNRYFVDDPQLNFTEHISDDDKEITKVVIESFLIRYCRNLLQKDIFKHVRHYFIMVMPLSLMDHSAGQYIPIGNLYVIIGTKRSFPKEIYSSYLQKLKALWFRDYGAEVMKKFYDKKRSDEHVLNYQHLHLSHKRKFTHALLPAATLKNRNSNYSSAPSLIDYFKAVFDSNKFNDLLNTYLIDENSHIVTSLVRLFDPEFNAREHILNFYPPLNSSANIFTKKLDELFYQPINEETVKYFLQFLSKRRLALVLYLVFQMDFDDVQKSISGAIRSSKSKSRRDYMAPLFVFKDRSKTTKILSKNEVIFLRSVLKRMQRENYSYFATLEPTKWNSRFKPEEFT